MVIGRNSSSYDDVSADHTMMGQTIFDPSNNNNGPAATAAGIAGLVTRAGNPSTTWIGFNTRFNNSVKYTSPNFSGFSGSFMYAMGEDKATPAPANKTSKTISANLKYANGPLLVSGGYQSEAQGGTLGLGGTGAANAATDASKPALTNTLLSVAYDFGVAKVGAGFNRAKFKDVLIGGNAVDPQKEVSLSVAVPLGATTLSAGVARSKGDTLGKSTGYGIQALYSLSKRSTLYAGAETNKGYDKLVNAVNAIPGNSAGKTTTYGLGLRHTF